MKYLKILIIPLILIAVLSISCERDDICAESTATTPSVIIDVYDFDDQESKKNVINLVISGVDNDAILSDYELVSSNNIVLPLKTTENTTQYTLIKEASVNDNGTPDDSTDDFYDGDYDTLTINYSRKEVFVSRACGYKTIFENVTLTLDDTDNWILSQQPINSNQSVEDETTTHFNIYH